MNDSLVRSVEDIERSLWLQWHWDAGVLLFLGALAACYFYGIGPLRRRYNLGEPATSAQVALFISVIALIFVTLVSPLDAIGNNYLFSAHITQAFLLTTVVPPLLLKSLPDWLLNPLFRWPPLRRRVRGLSFLMLATLLFNATFMLWLIPSLYNAAVQSAPMHDFQNLTFLLTGIINWWPLVTPLRDGPRWAQPVQLLYLFLDGIPLGLLCVILFFVDHSLYSVYDHAPRLWGISILADLQLGSIILYVPGLFIDMAVLSVIFFKWLAHQEAEARKREEAEDAEQATSPEAVKPA